MWVRHSGSGSEGGWRWGVRGVCQLIFWGLAMGCWRHLIMQLNSKCKLFLYVTMREDNKFWLVKAAVKKAQWWQITLHVDEAMLSKHRSYGVDKHSSKALPREKQPHKVYFIECQKNYPVPLQDSQTWRPADPLVQYHQEICTDANPWVYVMWTAVQLP